MQDSPAAKSASGFNVKVVGPPVTAAVWAPLVPHAIVNQLPATLTGSVKATDTLASRATPVALSAS